MKMDASWLTQADIQTLAKAFAAGGNELRFVGGCVRDTVMGRPFTEMDAATNATPEQTTALLEKAGIRAIPTGIDHGTITALINERPFEITTLRKDVATDGRHAKVAFGTSWEEDARRRDFTMNALYLGLDGTLYDYVGGLEDCKQQRLRFIGDASLRIREDYLRILRYFRFAAQLGITTLDKLAVQACSDNKAGIMQLSGERITAELLKLLAAKQAHSVLVSMQESGVLQEIFGDVSINSIRILDEVNAPALVKLAALIRTEIHLKSLSIRLKLSAKQIKQIGLWLQHYKEFTPALSDHKQKKLMRKLAAEDYLAALQLAAALAGNWKSYAPLATMCEWTPPPFPVSAKDLMALGFKEGKELGDKLKELESAWEESGYSLTQEALLTQLR